MFNLNFLLPLFVFAGIIILVLLTLCKHLNDLKKASSLKVNPNVRRQMINDGYFPYIIPITSSTNNYNNNGTIFTTPTSVPVTIVETGIGTATTTATMISYPSSYPSTVDQLFINALSSSSSSSTSRSRSTSSSILPTTLILQSQLNQNDSSDIYKIHKYTPPPKYDEYPPPCYEDAIAIDKNLKNSETSIAIEPSIPSKK